MRKIRLPRGEYTYDETSPIGKRGGFGQVFAGTSKSNSNLAVKKLHIPQQMQLTESSGSRMNSRLAFSSTSCPS